MLTWKSVAPDICDMLFFNAAKYVCLWCPTFSAYLEKKRSEGKHYNVAICRGMMRVVAIEGPPF